jgi:hypothetical protein
VCPYIHKISMNYSQVPQKPFDATELAQMWDKVSSFSSQV